jgi:hypothetical protein
VETIDRERLSSYREAARRARAEYVHCLLLRLAAWFRLRSAPARAVPCGG